MERNQVTSASEGNTDVSGCALIVPWLALPTTRFIFRTKGFWQRNKGQALHSAISACRVGRRVKLWRDKLWGVQIRLGCSGKVRTEKKRHRACKRVQRRGGALSSPGERFKGHTWATKDRTTLAELIFSCAGRLRCRREALAGPTDPRSRMCIIFIYSTAVVEWHAPARSVLLPR